jgi:hypothetical protein
LLIKALRICDAAGGLSPAQPVAIFRSSKKITLQKPDGGAKWMFLKPDVPNDTHQPVTTVRCRVWPWYDSLHS